MTALSDIGTAIAPRPNVWERGIVGHLDDCDEEEYQEVDLTAA
jgi:hypothetical protein